MGQEPRKLFGREPAEVVAVVNALIMVAGTFGLALFTQEHAALWVAVVNGISAAVMAWTTRPISVGVFSQLIATIVALLAGYRIELDPEFVFALNGALSPILLFITRGQVSPIETRITHASEAANKPEVQTVPEG